MKKAVTLILLISILFTGCGPASLPPPTVVPVLPTKTYTPTPLPTATATPYPALQTNGPYLLFTYDRSNFIIMDADGTGRKQFQLPSNGYVGYQLENVVSPDGKWLAYFTGSTDEPYDLVLNLFNLEDESTSPITNLLAKKFPQNLEPSIEELEFEGCFSNECKFLSFKFSLLQGIETLEWSPDGKQLAFAAQIDGLSSDIYIFNLEDKTILRLTDEPENIFNITWSPNSQKVLYAASIDASSFFPSSIWHLADLTAPIPQNPIALTNENSWNTIGWFNENLFFISTAMDGSVAIRNAMYVDINTKKTKVVWPYIADRMIFDSKNNHIILSFTPHETNNPQSGEGTYLLYLDGTFTKITDEFFYLFPEQIASNSYLAIDKNKSLVIISTDGLIIHSSQTVFSEGNAYVSPNKNWVMLTSGNRTELFSKDLQLIKSWDIDGSDIIWSTDSMGAFLYDLHDKDQLYYVSIPDGTPTPIDACVSRDCWQFGYVWLPQSPK